MVSEVGARAARTDVDGRFELRGVPGRLAPYQSLALLVEHDFYPSKVHLGLGRRLDLHASEPVDVVMESGRRVALGGLPADTEVTIVQGIAGVPLTALANTFTAATDQLGRAVLESVGSGPCYVVDVTAGVMVALSPAADGSDRLDVARGPARHRGDLASFSSLLETPGVSLGVGRTRRSPSRHRYQMAASRSPDPTRPVAVLDAGQQVAVSQARVFLRSADGQLVYLGEHDNLQAVVLSEAAERPYTLIAVAADGQVGMRLIADEADESALVIAVAEPGGVQVGAGAVAGFPGGHPVLLRFERLDGPSAGDVIWRQVRPETAGLALSGLLPGKYAVGFPDGRKLECEILAGSDIQLDGH